MATVNTKDSNSINDIRIWPYRRFERNAETNRIHRPNFDRIFSSVPLVRATGFVIRKKPRTLRSRYRGGFRIKKFSSSYRAGFRAKSRYRAGSRAVSVYRAGSIYRAGSCENLEIKEEQIEETPQKPQWIVSQRILSHLQ